MSWLAVVGLALAFGAQSLIKDFFSGFMILLEQQYMVNDVVKIDDVTGQVERITLRMTVLRDLEGHVHFIPHGGIQSGQQFDARLVAGRLRRGTSPMAKTSTT